ncbi:KRAB-A domain-containing protein 2-like [Onthophagus taurus]|uniref:KRAB-A domain-containing protein 2-like n=1 Tax=Onthophagus taurus TaxID=166361 RepID=UPI0039BDA851
MESEKYLVEKQIFDTKLFKLIENSGVNNFTTVLTVEHYLSILNQVKNSMSKKETKERLSCQDYRRLNRFEILRIGDKEKIIAKRKNDDVVSIRYYCDVTEVHGILEKVHKDTGHKRRLGMEKEIAKKYCNIPRSVIEEYLKLCAMCQLKRKSKQKGLVVKPIISTGFNKRGQIDLIDMQTEPDGPYKFIMNYQDHLTKFVFLKPLKTKKAEEVAYNLMDIFGIVGAPCLLHSDNGREFVNQVITSLADMFQAKIIHGKPRHSQSQGSIEKANQDVRDILITWMQENETTKWAEGLRFVQLKKNRSFHRGIQRTPYEAMFVIPLVNGLKDSNLPLEIVEKLHDEDDIYRLESSVGRNIEQVVSKKSHSEFQNSDGGNEKDVQESFPINYSKNDDVEEELLRNNEIRLKSINQHRSHSIACLKKQATEMLQQSCSKFPKIEIGQNVLVKTLDVDRGRLAPRNILAVVLSEKDDLYQLGTSTGVLEKLYARNEFQPSQTNSLTSSDVPIENKLSLRTVAAKESNSSQGFVPGMRVINDQIVTKCGYYGSL